ncbi:MAG: N-6 DNA methylase [Nitrososphaerota archaeon]|jgi:type I restriction enzyme M protein|nr:SAM-dependent methyltransferase [Nitrososphaerota archaeon]MDG6932034.1 N-6 DNA methylase [Nitrososphaerota archaeon]MDG6935409.1 N-6 DNA methylase [Nitrososphaerota archaeon]MDG6944573.1 N-6 DNA methylase [Nitrososphaerota archaeon]
MEANLSETQISALKRAADITRARIDYRYLLALVFIKSKLEPASGWEKLSASGSDLLNDLSKATAEIAGNDPSLKHMNNYFDFAQFSSVKGASESLRQLVEILNSSEFNSNSLGDAFEWLLKYYAFTHTKEGEAYTPREVVNLLVKIANPRDKESVYDPAMGYGGFLIYSHKWVTKDCAACDVNLYGQELSAMAHITAVMNMQVHKITSYYAYMDDTLLFPRTQEAGKLKKFDVILSNPPWNLYGYDENVLKKGDLSGERYPFGYTSLESADWAWIQHALASTDQENGRVGLVMDAECLSRPGPDKIIRSKIVDADLLEAVILLPERIFYHTQSSSSILVFRPSKPSKTKNSVVLINASMEKESHRESKRINYLGEDNISRIVKAYLGFNNINGMAHVATVNDIRKKDYNINPSAYVSPMSDVEL